MASAGLCWVKQWTRRQRNGQGRNGCGGRSSQDNNTSTGYYSTADWEKLFFDERDKIYKECNEKGEQGGSKRTISELTTKELTTAIITSIQKANAEDGTDDTPPKKSNTNQAGNAFGGNKESAKRSKTDWLAALSCALAAYQSTTMRAASTIHRTILSIHHTHTQTARCELDSHVDTCAIGSNFVLLHYTGWVCDVAPYNSEAYDPDYNI